MTTRRAMRTCHYLVPVLSAVLLFATPPRAEAQPCDFDLDGYADIVDNCPTISNLSQANQDGDPLGDDCDAVNDFDYDGDGVGNEEDNCPLSVNPTQTDVDADGTGDVCDWFDHRDMDGDDIPNEVDNCPFVINASQANADLDSLGDACESVDDRDYDADAVLNPDDNCPLDDNIDQLDTDQDGLGDVCDPMGAPGSDEYQCYAVKDLKQPVFVKLEGVSLEDQFSTATGEIVKVANVCAPVERNNGAILDPLTFRCCYKVNAPKLETNPIIAATEALQNSRLEIRKATTLCVPCTVSVTP